MKLESTLAVVSDQGRREGRGCDILQQFQKLLALGELEEIVHGSLYHLL
jgi:hypothetical protein